MKKSYITEKDSQLEINGRLLCMFSAPLLFWIVGLIYFSMGEIVLFNRAPLAVNGLIFTLVIIGAHVFAIAFCGLLPRISTWLLRILLPLGAIATLMLLLPLPENVSLILYYYLIFTAHFSIYMYTSIVSQLFTVGTSWLSSALCIGIGGLLAAVLKNDIFVLSFTVFCFVGAICLILASGFLYFLPLLPGTVSVPFSTWNDRIKLPVITFSGIQGLIFLSTFIAVFAVNFANGIYHGCTFLFISAAAFSLISVFAWTVLKSNAIKAFVIFFLFIIAGIVCAFFARTMLSLHLVSCVLLGFAVTVWGTWTFLLSVSFSMHPSRFSGVVGSFTVMIAITLSSLVYTALKEHFLVLCIIYTVAAILLLVLYLFMLKYFIYAFESKTLGTNIKLVGRPFSLPHKIQTARNTHRFDQLSNVELMVVKLLLEGYPIFSIALNMCISYQAAREHKSEIYQKLGIRFKPQLFRLVSKDPYEF